LSRKRPVSAVSIVSAVFSILATVLALSDAILLRDIQFIPTRGGSAAELRLQGWLCTTSR
jgi:hypothetical protein